MWQSTNPGIMKRPSASITCMPGFLRAAISRLLPAAMIAPLAMAKASAKGWRASIVRIRPLVTRVPALCPSMVQGKRGTAVALRKRRRLIAGIEFVGNDRLFLDTEVLFIFASGPPNCIALQLRPDFGDYLFAAAETFVVFVFQNNKRIPGPSCRVPLQIQLITRKDVLLHPAAKLWQDVIVRVLQVSSRGDGIRIGNDEIYRCRGTFRGKCLPDEIDGVRFDTRNYRNQGLRKARRHVRFHMTPASYLFIAAESQQRKRIPCICVNVPAEQQVIFEQHALGL